MASKYIECEAALKAIHEEWDDVCNYDGSGSEIANEMEAVIGSVPAADVAPVVRGRWTLSYDKWTPTKKCSSCGSHFWQFAMKEVGVGDKVAPVLNFCPNCGADMREVANE